MIEHIVLIKIKEGQEGEIEKICKSLNSLKDIIPEIIQINAGRNLASRSQGFQMGLSSVFASEEDLHIYDQHPAHQKILKNMIAPVKEDVIAFDFQRP